MSSYSRLRTSLFLGFGFVLVGSIAVACGSSDSTGPLVPEDSDASSDASVQDATTSDPDTGSTDAQVDASSDDDASADAEANDASEDEDASTDDASTDDAGDDAGGDAGASTCSNKKKDGTETSIDCGGDCAKCADGQGCKVSADCQSGKCSALFICGGLL